MDKIKKEIQEIEKKEINPPLTLLKKAGTFLIILMIFSYLSLGQIFPYLISNSESYTIHDKQIEFKNFQIIFKGETYDLLIDHYLKNEGVEIAACLNGKINESYNIEKIVFPRVINNNFNSITHEPCNKEAIIQVHSHPYGRCIPSFQDFKTLNKRKKINKNLIMMILCSKTKVGIYQ